MTKKVTFLLALALLVPAASELPAQQGTIDSARVDAVVKAAFPRQPADWASRIGQDETMRVCSATNNAPSAAQADAIMAREKATIKYPPDGKLIGDWKKGEELAQSGYGMRFTDYPPARPTGGNCYACHQLTKEELSFGTVGPSLLEYGKIRKFKDEDVRAAYDKIYNAHASFPCSLMPRFGSNAVLTIDQIKDLVALLMSPDSPVNK